jgi:hypothetical protein
MTDITNGEVLCLNGLKDGNSKCNLESYGNNMTVDSSAGLVKCNTTLDQQCYYNNTDGSVSEESCGCAMNEAGSSWCRAAPKESN